jgi:signal peptidase I
MLSVEMRENPSTGASAANPSNVRTRLIPSRRQAALAITIAIVLLLINDQFFFESLVIPTSSMRPTILPNERVLLRKFHYSPVRRFDVVVIRSRKLGRRIAKRVIALPGERVRIDQEWRVYINGLPLNYTEEDSDHHRTESDRHLIQTVPGQGSLPEATFAKDDFLLGPDEYFVMGDNRLASDDSRAIGPISQNEIEGKLVFVWYSFDLQAGHWRGGRWMRGIK